MSTLKHVKHAIVCRHLYIRIGTYIHGAHTKKYKNSSDIRHTHTISKTYLLNTEGIIYTYILLLLLLL